MEAALRLADLLAEQGHVDELRARADAGDASAAIRLADLLARQGGVDEAIAILRAQLTLATGPLSTMPYLGHASRSMRRWPRPARDIDVRAASAVRGCRCDQVSHWHSQQESGTGANHRAEGPT